jgi:hypothetical protein
MINAGESITVDRIELEESTGLSLTQDLRPRMDELPPVRLIAVEDVRLPTAPGTEAALDRFYVGLLQFARDVNSTEIVYRAENARLRFEIIPNQKPVERDGIRPQGIEVRSLRDMERLLIDIEIEYTRERGLLPGIQTLLLRDPAGNWIELTESREV